MEFGGWSVVPRGGASEAEVVGLLGMEDGDGRGSGLASRRTLEIHTQICGNVVDRLIRTQRQCTWIPTVLCDKRGFVPTRLQRVPHEVQTSRYIGVMTTARLHERLSSVASGKTYRALSDMTETHPETVRRYLQGQSPSVEFLAALCRALGINADWLLTGRGPVRVEEVRAHVLREANPTELHAAMASTISALVDRVDRLETYCQTLETLVRGSCGRRDSEGADGDGRASEAIGSATDEQADPAIVEAPRARRVADAVAKRPRPDAD